MDYYINPQSLSGVFTVPSAVADRYLKLTKPEHIKALIYILRHMADDCTTLEIAEGCGIDEYDVKEALLYWADAGILLPKETSPIIEAEPLRKKAIIRTEKPSRSDIAKRSLEDPKIQYLLSEAQIKLGRNLKDNETRTLVWLYDDEGLDVSVILLIMQYAVAKGNKNIRFIETLANDLINKGITNIADADNELHKLDLGEKAWLVVSAAFGLERRKPSKKELETSALWIGEWEISKEMLVAAYDECVNQKSKFSFAYTAKIIENWHKNGMKPTDKKPKKKDEGFASYDLDLYEKMVNSKD